VLRGSAISVIVWCALGAGVVGRDVTVDERGSRWSSGSRLARPGSASRGGSGLVTMSAGLTPRAGPMVMVFGSALGGMVAGEGGVAGEGPGAANEGMASVGAGAGAAADGVAAAAETGGRVGVAVGGMEEVADA
jgi:hypothetical protein